MIIEIKKELMKLILQENKLSKIKKQVHFTGCIYTCTFVKWFVMLQSLLFYLALDYVKETRMQTKLVNSTLDERLHFPLIWGSKGKILHLECCFNPSLSKHVNSYLSICRMTYNIYVLIKSVSVHLHVLSASIKSCT